MLIKFAEYLPDLPAFGNAGALQAKNVLPAGDSYQPWPRLVVYSSALSARCQGAVAARDNDGNTFNFAGDVSKLYKLLNATYSDVSVGGGYNTAAEECWYFSQFGNRFLATNFADAIQSWVLGTSSAFANLAATAPKARYITSMRGFVVVGNTFDAVDGNVPYRVRWSAYGDPTASWNISATTQADYNDLDSSRGWVQQVVGGEYGVIFQERAITRMEYVGSPIVFQFREVESGRGTPAPGSVVKVGNWIAYLGIDGFYIFDGNQSVPIGVNKIDKTFWAEVDLSYLNRICSCVDLDKQIIYWSYPATGNTAGRCNKVLAYNYSPNAAMRWSFAEIETETLFISVSEGYTLDGLDAVSATLEGLPNSLDWRGWTGSNAILTAFDQNHKQANFTGTALDAVIDTAEAQITPGYRTDVTLLRPMVDGSGTVTVQVGTRNNLSDTVAFGAAVSVNASGFCPVRSNARYHRARVNISGGFNDAQGIDLAKFTKAGMR